MEDSPDKTPAVLNYASTSEPGGWPVGWYAAALVWAYLTLSWLTMEFPMTEEARLRNFARDSGQLPLLACMALRLGWARLRGDKSKVWVFYVAVLMIAAPLWLYAEPFLRR